MNTILLRRGLAIAALVCATYALIRWPQWPKVLGIGIGLSFVYMMLSFEAAEQSFQDFSKSLKELSDGLTRFRAVFDDFVANPPRLEITVDQFERTVIRRVSKKDEQQTEPPDNKQKQLPPGHE